jgi:FixJ family two-component response regulator
MPKTAVARAVCIIDPDASVRQGLARLLSSAGLDSRSFESAEAFLLQPPAQDVACALLDVSGSGLRAPALQSRVRAMAAAVPVIALSARDDLETRRMARKLGAQAFFRKPVDAAALLDSIDWVTRAEAPGKAE